MPDTSPNLNLPLIAPSQAMKHVTHNEALVRLDAVTQLSVQAFDATMPPSAPQEGECYSLGVSTQDVWTGHDAELAVFSNCGWLFMPPQQGWRARDVPGSRLMVFDAGQWMVLGTSFDTLSGLGINSVHDSVNRFTLTSEASLFNHEGGATRSRQTRPQPRIRPVYCSRAAIAAMRRWV
jgi:hypothetical protein